MLKKIILIIQVFLITACYDNKNTNKKLQINTDVTEFEFKKSEFKKLKKIIISGDDNISYQLIQIDSNFLVRRLISFKDNADKQNEMNNWLTIDADGNLDDMNKSYFYQSYLETMPNGEYYLTVFFTTRYFPNETKYLIIGDFNKNYSGIIKDTIKFESDDSVSFRIKKLKLGENTIRFILLSEAINSKSKKIERRKIYGNYCTYVIKQ
jgi:hypothetical protein